MTPSTRDVSPDRPAERPGLDHVNELVATFRSEHPSDSVTVDPDAARRFIAATDAAWDQWSTGHAEHPR